MHSRMVVKKGNFWASNLKKTIDAKIHKKLKNKGEVTQLLRVHQASAENILRNLVKANSKKRIFNQINEWINQISLTMNEKIRENLYNIEQYRADALNLPEIKAKLPEKGSKGISSSTKTSGTSNLVSG